MTGAQARPIRVALLNPCFWPEVRRGSERFVRDLADGLIARDHRPRLITSHPGRPRRDVEDGLPIVRHWRPPEELLVRRGFQQRLTHVPFSYLSLRGGHDDIAQALYPTDALAAVRWGRRTGRPTILSYMGLPRRAELASRRFRVEVVQGALHGVSAVVALSAAAADAIERWFGIRPRVIHPGVDVSRFTQGGERADAPTIFSPAAVGEPRKRLPLLAAAFQHVRRERPGARLLLSEPRVASAESRALAASEGIEFVRVDDHDALVAAYRSAWVVALPSVAEAFGLVLVEALACGTPVVGTRHGGIPEIVDRPELGRLFEADDEGALARALLEGLELARDSGVAAAARSRAEELSTERCADAYESLYRELLVGGG